MSLIYPQCGWVRMKLCPPAGPYYERLGYHAYERVELRSAPGRYFWVMRKKL